MRQATRSLAVGLGLALAAISAQAAGTVQVSFVQPDQFADAGDARRDVEGNVRVLARHLESLAVRLGAGQKLSIEVIDVDLAGELQPWGHAQQDLRVLRGAADIPRIKLRYTLEASGQASRSGEQVVTDLGYLQRINRYPAGEALRYEKRMLDEWFSEQFAVAPAK